MILFELMKVYLRKLRVENFETPCNNSSEPVFVDTYSPKVSISLTNISSTTTEIVIVSLVLTILGLNDGSPCNASFWHLSQTAARQIFILNCCSMWLRELSNKVDTRCFPKLLKSRIHLQFQSLFPLSTQKISKFCLENDLVLNPSWNWIWNCPGCNKKEIK